MLLHPEKLDIRPGKTLWFSHDHVIIFEVVFSIEQLKP